MFAFFLANAFGMLYFWTARAPFSGRVLLSIVYSLDLAACENSQTTIIKVNQSFRVLALLLCDLFLSFILFIVLSQLPYARAKIWAFQWATGGPHQKENRIMNYLHFFFSLLLIMSYRFMSAIFALNHQFYQYYFRRNY